MRKGLGAISRYLAYVGCLGVLIGLLAWMIKGRFDQGIVLFPLFVGVVLIGIYMLDRPADVWRAISGRQARYGGNAALMIIAFAGILIFVNYLSNRYHARWDLTEERAYSLSPQTIQILKGLKEPVVIAGFFSASDSRRSRVQDLLDEYRFHTAHISYEFIDPDLKPAMARQYGVNSSGVLVLDRGEKRQLVSAVDEQDLTSAILKVSRDEEKSVYFVTGHGERDPLATGDDGYSLIAGDLVRDNYRVGILNLATLSGPVPEDAAALIVASSHIAFTEIERNLLIDFLYGGGHVMMTFDPGVQVVDSYLMDDWGVRVRNDLVIDPPSSYFGDIATPLVARYPVHDITNGMGGLMTYFAYARSLEVVDTAPGNLQIAPIVQTSQSSWGETKISRDMQVQYDEKQDTLGPLIISLAVEESGWGGRLVVFGDSDFVTNSVLTSVGGSFGNADLFMRAVNWLTEDDDLITITSRQTANRQIILTRPRMRLILYSSVIILPLAILAVGAATWWANR